MARRGATPFEEKIGVERFKELTKRLSPAEISKLYCNHYVDEDEKAKCKSCIRAVYRAMKRVREQDRAKKGLEPIDLFEDIPEIQTFIEYERDVKQKKSWKSNLNQIKEFWMQIREDPELKQISRPALWDERHIIFILKKLKEREIALYAPKKALRMFFESQGNHKLRKLPLIGARRKDMRSPKGAKRKETSYTPNEYAKIREFINSEEKLGTDIHVTVKSREGDKGRGSLLDAQWKHINWHDSFYGFPTVTIDIYEPKTKGGTWWRHIPLDLWFGDLSKRLFEKWEKLGKPAEGYILDFTYQEYLKLWHKISWFMKKKLEPHDCRRSAGSWLRDLGCSELALGQYNPTTGEAIGYTGVGWENSEIYFQRYGKMNPKAIYNKRLRLDTNIFTGLIHKILENK